MRSKLKVTAVMLVAAFIFMGSAVCISLSVSNDAGGFSQDISADEDDTISARVVLSRNALSDEITLSGGSLKDRHWIESDSGDRAEVGVDIKNAHWISYSYLLDKGSDYASAEESIDAEDAGSIKAYARADSQQGDSAESSITISDKRKEASLLGYSNYAYAGSGYGTCASVAGQIFDHASGDHIVINERSLQSDGDMAFASMSVTGGRVDSYYGAASAGIGEDGYYYSYDNESGYWSGRWDGATANHYGDIFGRSIDITEFAARPDGEVARSKTNIRDGQVDGYNGNASVWLEHQRDIGTRNGAAFLDEQWLETTWVSHGASDLGGSKVVFEERAIQADGDAAGARFGANGVPQEEKGALPYFGGAQATISNSNYWDGYRTCNRSSNLVWAYHFGDIAGRRIDLDEWSRKFDGGLSSTSARIDKGYTWFNSSAGTEIGSRICHDPEVVDVAVTDKTWASQDLADLNGRRIYLTARALSTEKAIESARLQPITEGNCQTSSRAEILADYPFSSISVDWLLDV